VETVLPVEGRIGANGDAWRGRGHIEGHEAHPAIADTFETCEPGAGVFGRLLAFLIVGQDLVDLVAKAVGVNAEGLRCPPSAPMAQI